MKYTQTDGVFTVTGFLRYMLKFDQNRLRLYTLIILAENVRYLRKWRVSKLQCLYILNIFTFSCLLGFPDENQKHLAFSIFPFNFKLITSCTLKIK